MPQIQLPFFPEGVTQISDLLAFRVEDGRVAYFNGNMPVFIHDKDDIATFRMITESIKIRGRLGCLLDLGIVGFSEARIPSPEGLVQFVVQNLGSRLQRKGSTLPYVILKNKLASSGFCARMNNGFIGTLEKPH